MKKNLLIAGIIILLAVVAVLTVWRMGIFGTRPIAPSAPESRPKAQVETLPNITPAPGCKVSFGSAAVPTPACCCGNPDTCYGCQMADPGMCGAFGTRPGPMSCCTALPTATPTPMVCSIPSPKPILSGSPQTRIDLYWNCDQPGVDCFALERYEYPVSGSCSSGGRTCGDLPANPVATIAIPRESTVSSCYSVDDSLTADKDKCVAYKVVAKDFTSSKNCLSCNANNNQDCCLLKSEPIKFCGLPAQPGLVSRLIVRELGKTEINLSWKDNSLIEEGYKIYRRTGGGDDFPVNVGESPIKIVPAKSGSGGNYLFTDKLNIGTGFSDTEMNSYRYSVKAFTNLCGCAPVVTPIVTPLATSTPVPGATSTPTPVSQPSACFNVQVTIAAGGSLSNLKIGDVLAFSVNFNGTVQDVAVIVKKDGVRVATFAAGSQKAGTWTTPSYTINSLGSYEIMAFVKIGGIWQ